MRRGFTLIEVLIVVVLVSILMSVVVGTFSGTNREQVLLGFVERLNMRIEMARDRAVQSNREWGIYVGRDELRFAEFDPVNGEWLEQSVRPFTRDADAEGLEFKAEVEAYAASSTNGRGVLGSDIDDGLGGGLGNARGGGLATDDEEDIPQIILFSSGEVTPFELEVTTSDWEALPWLLSSDGFSRTERNRGERL